MNDLYLIPLLPKIESWIVQHIKARVEIVRSKDDIDGKLGQSRWGSQIEPPLIRFPEHITSAEISDSLLALSMRGHIDGYPQLVEHANSIESPEEYLEHLVLHEVAHIKHNWAQFREIDCDLWVYERMHNSR